MGSEGTNHLTTLFLISNSFNGFGFGLILFAFGVGSSVIAEVAEGFVICIITGLAIIGVSLTGTWGAIAQGRKKLNTYATFMAVLTVLEIIHLVVLSKSPVRRDDLLRAYFITMIFIIVISIVSILLALIMQYRIYYANMMAEIAAKKRRQANP